MNESSCLYLHTTTTTTRAKIRHDWRTLQAVSAKTQEESRMDHRPRVARRNRPRPHLRRHRSSRTGPQTGRPRHTRSTSHPLRLVAISWLLACSGVLVPCRGICHNSITSNSIYQDKSVSEMLAGLLFLCCCDWSPNLSGSKRPPTEDGRFVTMSCNGGRRKKQTKRCKILSCCWCDVHA